MIMLAMTILVHFWVVYWATEPPTLTPRSTLWHYTVQPNYLAHASQISGHQPSLECRLWIQLCLALRGTATTAHPAAAHAHALITNHGA